MASRRWLAILLPSVINWPINLFVYLGSKSIIRIRSHCTALPGFCSMPRISSPSCRIRELKLSVPHLPAHRLVLDQRLYPRLALPAHTLAQRRVMRLSGLLLRGSLPHLFHVEVFPRSSSCYPPSWEFSGGMRTVQLRLPSAVLLAAAITLLTASAGSTTHCGSSTGCCSARHGIWSRPRAGPPATKAADYNVP